MNTTNIPEQFRYLNFACVCAYAAAQVQKHFYLATGMTVFTTIIRSSGGSVGLAIAVLSPSNSSTTL